MATSVGVDAVSSTASSGLDLSACSEIEVAPEFGPQTCECRGQHSRHLWLRGTRPSRDLRLTEISKNLSLTTSRSRYGSRPQSGRQRDARSSVSATSSLRSSSCTSVKGTGCCASWARTARSSRFRSTSEVRASSSSVGGLRNRSVSSRLAQRTLLETSWSRRGSRIGPRQSRMKCCISPVIVGVANE